MPRTVTASYAGAANAALERALCEYPNALLFGEDVARPGGIFGVTKGLHKQFGERVFDTPISESVILGGAVGSAMMGMRPIVEIMWADFSLVALDQLVNQAANVRYNSRGRLSAPMTVRTQQGIAPGACAQHAQSLEAIFAHIPGLQVCMPANAQDAYDLLLSAIASEDPAIVIENRTLYHGEKVDIQVDTEIQSVGGARVKRQGDDVTIVSWGATVNVALQAAETLAARGIDAEVIDLRWLRPYDLDSILESVSRTGRLVVVQEAHTAVGFAAEVIAAVSESGVPLLSPPSRVGTPDARIPAAPVLATTLAPSPQKIEAAVERSVGRGAAVLQAG
ncbi:MAG: acetoin dehydrogenase [Candidatus Leucobacter sulfamidivorax]|nr:acetoin dehydrogenase [Candidatus Leucobacter sulfamidivorax]